MMRLCLCAITMSILMIDSLTAGKIRFEGADQLRSQQTEQGTIIEFIGNVRIARDSSDLYADYAVWYESREFVRLIGNVYLRQPGRELKADSLHYDQRSEIARAWSNVIVEDRLRHVRVTGRRAILFEREEIVVVSGEPRLLIDFDQPTVPTSIVADTIRFYSQSESVEAVGAVDIRQGSLEAKADSALMGVNGAEIELFGNVRAAQRSNELLGKRMTVRSENKVIERIKVGGSGEAIYRQPVFIETDTTVYNQSRLTADSIDFFFVNDLLHLIKAKGNSYVYYTPALEDTTARGSNTASGDSTILLFDGQELREVTVVTSAEGKYQTVAKRDSLGQVAAYDTIAYKADRIQFQIAANMIRLRTGAQVKQGTIVLDADRIDYDLNRKVVYAHARDDTARGPYQPLTLRDGAEALDGDELVFNTADRRGKIKNSKTKLEQAYYSSQVLRKEEEGEFLVRDGVYTTCESPEPHFHFQARDMKLKTDDRVIARPVVLYIETLPVLALPYFVFSIKKDRHSGFLPLQFGNFERGSRFVNNIGYYWAVNDYWDLKTSIDVSDFGLKFNTGVRYALRYKLSGSLSGSYTRETEFADRRRGSSRRGQFSFSHSQTIDPTLSIQGSGAFVSDSRYFSDFSTDLQNRLRRQITSNIGITKRWEGPSLTASVEQTRDLDLQSHSERLPSLRFSLPQRPVIGKPKVDTNRRWYHDLYYSYSNQLLNSQSKSMRDLPDTTIDGRDTVRSTATRKKYAVFEQAVGLNAPVKLGGVITTAPSLSIRDYWYYLPESDQAESFGVQTNSLHSRQVWSGSVSLSTNLYGVVAPNIFSVTGLRHVFSPSVSFNYQPKIERNAEFARFTGFGGAAAESKSLGLRINNSLAMKYLKDGKESKLDLLNFDFSTSYNFKATSRKWANVASSIRAPQIKKLTLQASFTHDLYEPVSGKLRWWSPYLRNVSVSAGYSGAIKLPIGNPNSLQVELSQHPSTIQYSIAERFSESRDISSRKSLSHWIDFSLSFSPSKNWRLQYRQNYNVRGKEATDMRVELYRDLHCWEGVFTWIPDGSLQGYYFRINVKQLPDIKFEKSESGIRDALFGGFQAFQQ